MMTAPACTRPRRRQAADPAVATLLAEARDERERRTLRDARHYDELVEYLRAPATAAVWAQAY